MAKSMFNLGNTWNLKPKAQKLDIEVFFRGIGGVQDTILTLVKLKEAGIPVHQYVMIDGLEDKKGVYQCHGEAELGITTFYMPEQKDFVENVYKALLNLDQNKLINKKHWLNDHDQYSKIQVRHRINDGDWSDWVQTYSEE